MDNTMNFARTATMPNVKVSAFTKQPDGSLSSVMIHDDGRERTITLTPVEAGLPPQQMKTLLMSRMQEAYDSFSLV